jgi:hypothetical protein
MKVKQGSSARFSLGRIVATADALAKLTQADILAAISRHQSGDWGTLDEHDREANDFALEHGERLLSVYSSEAGVKFYVITEWDRSATTVLLPEDY